MPSPVKILRRPAAGAAGPPASLLSGQLAFNENNDILYYGRGDNGSGVATSIVTIGGTNLVNTSGTGATGTWGISISGNAATASAWQTGRTISLTGDLTGTSAAWTGSGNISFATTLANSGVTAGTYTSVTVDTKGRVTGGTNPTTLAGYGITNAPTTTGTGATGTWGISITGDAASVDGKSFGTFTAAGGILYATSTTDASAIGAGTAGQALLSGGSGAPTWATLTLENLPDAVFKRSVRAATTANITLSGTQTIDGIAVVAGDRVLVKNQSTTSQNGIYVVSAGAWTRSADADTSAEIAGAIVNVDSGTAQGGQLWKTTFRTTDTLGTTAMTWVAVVINTGSWGISITGSAATWTTGRTITLTGDVTGTSAAFNGSANLSFATTLANSGVTAGTYRSVTVDAKGRVTAGTNPTTLAGYGITDALPLSGGTLTGGLTIAYASNANIEIGRVDGVASTPYIDFHSGATATDFDSRIIASSGSGASGGGILTLQAAQTQISGELNIGTTPAARFIDLNLDDGTTNFTATIRTTQNDTLHEDAITIVRDGAVTLFHDNVARIATTSSGGNIVGTLQADYVSVRAQNPGAGEGGEISLARPTASTTLAGDVIFDILGNSLRIFEGASPFRGLQVDLTGCGTQSVILHSANYNLYTPTLGGTGATGTWGISITGNAGTVTNGVYTTGNQTIAGTKTFSNLLVGSSTGKALAIGGSPGGPNASIANQTSFAELVFGAGGITNSFGLVFHNPSVSTSVLEYVNTDANTGYFNFRGDDTTWNVRINNNTVWHAGNDGSGSGLDADLLDGLNSSDFVRANEFDNTGNIRIYNASPTIGLIDTDHATASIHVNSNLFYILRNAAGLAGWSSVDGVWPFQVNLLNNDVQIGRTVISQSYQNIVKYSAPWRNDGVTALASSYNYVMTAGNDTGNKLSMFINSSTRTADGGANGLTFRNDGGPMSLGNQSFLTTVNGSQINIIGNRLHLKNNPAISNTSYAVGNCHIELQTNNASNPAIGFHRSGFTAVTLYHSGYGTNALRIRAADGADGQIWWAGNDGSGSGLDADLWDGYHLSTAGNWGGNSALDIVVGQLAWKNYGNNHTIFDASNGTAPNGTAVNNTNSQIAWAATFPTIMGWNGINTYGVRVDSARVADSATSAGSAGNLTGGTISGSYPVNAGINLRFQHPNQTDGNDGIIGAGIFASGLNIVGTQTTAGTGRQVRIWGTVIDSGGTEYVRNTGTWAINISGTATTATNVFINSSASSNNIAMVADTGTNRNIKENANLKYNAVNDIFTCGNLRVQSFIAPASTTGNIYIAPNSPGQARIQIYNGGSTAEWIFGQKTSSSHDFIFSKSVAAVETDIFRVRTDNALALEQATFHRSSTLATSGVTTIESPRLNLVSKWWNGTASEDRTMYLYSRGLSGNGAPRIVIGENNTDYFVFTGAGRLRIGDGGVPGFDLQLINDSAAKPSTSTWTVSSDERLKEDIEFADLDICYDNIKNIPLRRYKWKDEIYSHESVPDRRKLGWIAQEVAPIIPKAVSTYELIYNVVKDEEGEIISQDTIEDCMSLNSDQIIASLYGAVQKLMNMVETLTVRVESLEAS